MTNTEKAIEKALSLVGQGYIYGAKGQTCSPTFRRQQAEQYTEQADRILGEGAKWDGKPVWDCAQLTRAVARAGSVSLVSGATSQWRKTAWQKTGEITTIPPDTPCFVYRRQNGSDTVMAHTGFCIGDGTCVHARGTAYGVVHQQLSQHAWTHWAALEWGPIPEKESEETILYKAKVTAQNGSTVNMRTSPGGGLLDRVSVGSEVDVLAESAGWCQIQYNGKIGWMQSAFIIELGKNNNNTVSVTLPRDTAAALKAALDNINL